MWFTVTMWRSTCQGDRLPWSWCRHWAGWRECSCLLGPAGSLCTRYPGSWEEGRAGRAGRSPSPGLPRSLYLHNRMTQSDANGPALLHHVFIFGYKMEKSDTQSISSFKLWKQTWHVIFWIHLHPLWFHFLHQGYFIFYSCLFFMLAVLCSHLLSIIQFSQGFTCCFHLSVWFCFEMVF